jgi:hypothetical protein
MSYAILEGNQVVIKLSDFVPESGVIEVAEGRTYIKETPETGEIFTDGTYVDGKFYAPEGASE